MRIACSIEGMRLLPASAALGLVVLASNACGSSSSDGGSSGDPCTALASQLCQAAQSCTANHTSEYSAFLSSADPDAGIQDNPFTVNGDVSHCQGFMALACKTAGDTKFSAACASAATSPQCGATRFGAALVLPPGCP
jgi:hypothetical protein